MGRSTEDTVCHNRNSVNMYVQSRRGESQGVMRTPKAEGARDGPRLNQIQWTAFNSLM